MSSSPHSTIVPSDSDIKNTFSSMNILNYFSASPGSISPDSSNDFTKYLLDIPVFSPLHDDSKMEVIQAYIAIPPPQVVIALPAILPPSLYLYLHQKDLYHQLGQLHQTISLIVMSSSPHSTIVPSNSDIENTFSSMNILNYFSASPGSISPDSSNDFTKYLLDIPVFSPLHDDSKMEVIQAYNAIPPRQVVIALPAILPPSPNGSQRTSTSAAPAMNQAAIRQLIDDRVAAALEAQVANMANTSNTNRNPEQALVARKCSYKEFMSDQPFNFRGLEGAVGLICWFKHTESMFSRSNCTEDCKVKFATSTLTEEALSWWNSFAQPIGIEEAYKITWVQFKKLLIKKYYPRTEIQKMEDEFYHLTMKGNDLNTYDYLKVSKEMLPPLNLKL
uniref:Reverse transcriptase domain-containing protein n=1 Tax=Tanacetum cinerariifolium TaxID=118510 RepID=A0A6L2P5U3_TANCI|nr:reverse transcriptase domain-containing protein [Tanacetum cinerariifolium]